MWVGMSCPSGAQGGAVEQGDRALSVAEYVAALDGLRAALEAGRLEEARAAAAVLREREVVWAGEPLAPDPTVLDAIDNVQTPVEAGLEAARLRRLTLALGLDEGSEAVEAHPDVLSRVGPGPGIEKGGETPSLRVAPLAFPGWIERTLLGAADWIKDSLRKIRRWLRRLVPRREATEQGDAGTTAAVAIVFAAVVAALLAVLAVRSLRRGRGATTGGASSVIRSSSRDDDPLSRETSEWEVYARELATQRRWREAIRAWYHAVLVALFRSGVLHHQRGRTNWEYVSRLSPDLGWRPAFVTLTRRFDREWYGRRTSDDGALAECAREAQGVLRAVRDRGETA
jgi:hypothetical protein